MIRYMPSDFPARTGLSAADAVLVCSHGFYARDCAVCVKAPHECDFGSCVDHATEVLRFTRESRPLCSNHAAFVRRNPSIYGEVL